MAGPCEKALAKPRLHLCTTITSRAREGVKDGRASKIGVVPWEAIFVVGEVEELIEAHQCYDVLITPHDPEAKRLLPIFQPRVRSPP